MKFKAFNKIVSQVLSKNKLTHKEFKSGKVDKRHKNALSDFKSYVFTSLVALIENGTLTKSRADYIHRAELNKAPKAKRKVQDIETGIVYNCISEAARANQVHRATIYRRIKQNKYKYV